MDREYISVVLEISHETRKAILRSTFVERLPLSNVDLSPPYSVLFSAHIVMERRWKIRTSGLLGWVPELLTPTLYRCLRDVQHSIPTDKAMMDMARDTSYVIRRVN